MNGKKRIVITGAGGYIGSRLCQYLSLQGHEIIGIFRTKPPYKTGWSELISKFIVGDIREERTIKSIYDCNPQIIIHLVSLDHHDSENSPELVYKVNVQPLWNILNYAVDNNVIEKFINFSTIHVYGKEMEGLVEENSKVKPFNAYGLTHSLSEGICNYYNNISKIQCINFRLANSYGHPVFSDAKCWNLIVNDLAKSAYNEKKIILNSNGETFRDFIHFSDICTSVDSVITSTSKLENNTINLSSSQSVSMLEVAVMVQKVYEKKYGITIPIYINKTELLEHYHTNQGSANYIISNHLLKKELKTPVTTLAEGIDDLFNYLELESSNKS